MGDTTILLSKYGWIAIVVVLGGVCAYIYRESRKDKKELTDLYEKWIDSNKETNTRIDKLLDDYRKMIIKIATVMQKAMDKFDIKEDSDD